MNALRLPTLTQTELDALAELYRTTKDVRVRTRAQMILLAAEQDMTAPEIARIVRTGDETVRRWLKRYQAEGINGLYDAPRTGAPTQVTPEYRERLLHIVRRRPRSLNQPYSLWTLQRLADFMAEETGLRFSIETVRRILKEGGIVLSRPQHTISSPDPEYEVKKRRSKPSVIA